MTRDKDPFDELFEKILRDFFDRDGKQGEMGFVDIFEEMWPQFSEVDEELFREAVEKRRSDEGPFRFGFSVRMDQSGEPEIRSFGDRVKDEGRGPLVDVFDEGEQVTVTAEIPGVDEEDISVVVQDSRLLIEAESESDRYYREVELPRSVDRESMDMDYKNGVLSLRFKPK
ncbi:Molecular chaperone HSP20 family, IbpA [Methanonatronarchaeum thermophilum]|uniref:Molecular chaperone HSP20 family, IbpA n=1 Tax=Methanonatronarchaeum thermophilum TaxID=1927129 RepID=A0A1Y3GAI0_9EURY|nr:Hsp20/alpha crystallin family protein [Methanonatronarchaeum thermophilum]OUJ18250.1 Molecular chaperone HSP20 family, IbpA [Methanonatronarchaeum thermophilum]